MERYGASLLAKYPHKVYAERIRDIDPLEVTETDVKPQQ